MDDWMAVPGARVQGHDARVVGQDARVVACSCGHRSAEAGLETACLDLVRHLQQAVQRGAVVVGGDDGSAGVREPRRPLAPLGSAGAERSAT